MLLFNLLKVTSNVAADRLDPRTKIKGKFLAEKLPNNDNFIYLEDPNWKNSSMSYAHVLRDVNDNVVTVFLKKSVTIQKTSYKMFLETCQELVEISVAFEDSLHSLRNGKN